MKALDATSAGLSAEAAGATSGLPMGAEAGAAAPVQLQPQCRALELHFHTLRYFLQRTIQGKQLPSGRTHPHQTGACKPDIPGGFKVTAGQKIQVVEDG